MATGIDCCSDYSRIVGAEGSNFRRFAEGISLGSSLSSELKSVEMVMADSSILIASSGLESKDVILALVSKISANAREVSRELQKLTSRIGGAVDTCI